MTRVTQAIKFLQKRDRGKYSPREFEVVEGGVVVVILGIYIYVVLTDFVEFPCSTVPVLVIGLFSYMYTFSSFANFTSSTILIIRNLNHLLFFCLWVSCCPCTDL